MNKYEITDIGTNAAKQTGLKVGDIVCADQLARYYDTFPVSVIKYDSIIFKTDKDETFIEPLKGMVFVSMDKLEEDVQGGVLVLTDLLPVGTITHINVDGINMCDLKVGDKVLLSNDCDNVIYRGKKILIYKYENILATVEK
jgi:co-chaperonin GroES (HSP10)